jgi:hypothetical protein
MVPVEDKHNVTYGPVARQHNNIAEEVFSVWSAPRLFARQLSGNTSLQRYDKTVFSMEFDLKLYNESVLADKTRPLVRESARHQKACNRQTVIKIWS